MAITGISSYDGKQIIAAGAQSAISAGIASDLVWTAGKSANAGFFTGGPYGSGGFYVASKDNTKDVEICPDYIQFYNSALPLTGKTIQITSGKVAKWDSLSSTKQDKLTFNYDGNSQITGINSSAIAGGGGDVPEGVMVESGLEYNAQNKVTGYSGSAFATLDSECQFLTHDDTIVHVSNSAQYAFGVNLSGISADLARMMGVDETILYSGARTSAAQLSENLYNFEMLRVNDIYGNIYNIGTNATASQQLKLTNYGGQPQQLYVRFVLASSYLNVEKGFQLVNAVDGWNSPSTAWTTSNVNNTYSCEIISKVVGIHRISGGN